MSTLRGDISAFDLERYLILNGKVWARWRGFMVEGILKEIIDGGRMAKIACEDPAIEIEVPCADAFGSLPQALKAVRESLKHWREQEKWIEYQIREAA